jgi:hypothetical protein
MMNLNRYKTHYTKIFMTKEIFDPQLYLITCMLPVKDAFTN